jgi:hypothetical protein
VYSFLVDRRAVRHREFEYSERGTLEREQRWSPEVTALSNDSCYLNGQPRSKSLYGGSLAQRSVDIAEFHDSGRRWDEGRFRNGPRGAGSAAPMDTHQSFYEQSGLATKTTYDDRGRVTGERVFDAGGLLQHDDEVFEDGSHKAFAR